jgi:uncharacterized oxidoreductase
MNLTNNTILITGGATGIGLALVEKLEQTNKVIICGRRENKLLEVKKRFPNIHIKVCDLQNQEQRIELVEWLLQNHSDLNILINNAGIQRELNFLKNNILEDLTRETEINLIAPVHLCSLLISHLKTKTNAAIINVSSGLAFTPLAFMPMYCATKAALHSLCLSLRHQLSKTNIKVFEIIPPTVDTELDQGRRDRNQQSNRGISADECASQALEAVKNDIYEAAIGAAVNLRLKREEMFGNLNH